MKIKEAIRLLHPDTTAEAIAEIKYKHGFRGKDAAINKINKACEMACKSLEKRIPKKIELWNGQCSCPNCNKLFGSYSQLKTLIHWEMPYCKFCGQALDWSETEKGGESDA